MRMKSTFHKPQRPSLAVSDAYGKQSCCFPLSYSFLDKIRTATPSLPRKKKHIKTTHIKYAHRSSQCDEVAHPSKHSSCESWASIFKMHLWWPAISSGHHYHCHYQIQTYPPTTAATPPAAVKKCLPGNSRNNIINDTDMNLEFTSVQVFHAVGGKLLNLLGETLQLLVLCHSAAPGVPGELQRPMRQTWRRGRGQWQPPSPEEIPWVSLFPIAMDRWPSPKNLEKA